MKRDVAAVLLITLTALFGEPTLAQDGGSGPIPGNEELIGEYGYDPATLASDCEIGPLEMRAGEVRYYESVCEFAVPIPAGVISHVADVSCRGEGNLWNDVLSIRMISPSDIEIHSRLNNFAQTYARCPSRKPEGAITATDLDMAILCDAPDPLHWVVIVGANPRFPDGENDLDWSERLIGKIEACGEWNWVIDDTTPYEGRSPNLTFGFLRGFSSEDAAKTALLGIKSYIPDAYVARTCRSYVAD